MATDKEIRQLWDSFSEKMKQPDTVIHFYRHAENEGKQEGLLEMEKELVSDSPIEAAIQVFGFGRRNKAGTITQRAVIREATRIAIENIKKAGKNL